MTATLTPQRIETTGTVTEEEFQRFLDGPPDPVFMALLALRLDGGADPDAPPVVAMQQHDTPSKFLAACIRFKPGEGPTAYQNRVLDAFWQHGRYAVRGPRGMGKSCMAAWLILYAALYWESLGIDWKIVTTAAVYRQLKNYLWREVRKWAARLKWDAIGLPKWGPQQLQQMAIVLANGDATAAAAANNDHIEGAHATAVLFLIDEAKAVPDSTFDSIEGTFMNADRSPHARQMIFAISTPGGKSGRFADIHHDADGLEDWAHVHVTLAEAVAEGQISQRVADQRKRQWGERSALYQNQILGEFSTDDDDGIIPLSWLEAAVVRWEQLVDDGVIVERTNPNGRHGGRAKLWAVDAPVGQLGVDVGDEGPDETIIAPRWANVIGELHAFGKGDPLDTANRALAVARGWGDEAMPPTLIVDSIGVGSGVVAALRREKQDVVAFNAGSAATYRKGGKDVRFRDASGTQEFGNRRAHAWWHLRELLDPQNEEDIALPPGRELLADLSIPRYDTGQGGRIFLEAKEDIRKRLSRSTDRGDAVVEAFYPAFAAQREAPVAPLPLPFAQASHWGNPFSV